MIVDKAADLCNKLGDFIYELDSSDVADDFDRIVTPALVELRRAVAGHKNVAPVAWTNEREIQDLERGITGRVWPEENKHCHIAVYTMSPEAEAMQKRYEISVSTIRKLEADIFDLKQRNSALQSTVDLHHKNGEVLKELFTRTFVVQYSPNCTSPWLVRLPGVSGTIDLKPYAVLPGMQHETQDVLGFGKTFEDAAREAMPKPYSAKAEFRPQDVVDLAVECWHADVANRELANVHRRSLDDTWRQVIRKFGGNPDELIGPSHDELLRKGKGND